MVGEVFEDSESGHGENIFFAHDAHGFFAKLIGVVDGDDSGPCGVECARFTGGMHGHVFAEAGQLL